MADLFDEDALQKYFRRMNIDQLNQQAEQQGMAGMSEAASPPPSPYVGGSQKKGGFFGTIGKIVAPVMKLGGMAANFLGAPYIGVPLTLAGGAVGGASGGGGITGALKGTLKSGLGEAASFGIGSGLSALTSAAPQAIMTGSKLSAPLSAAIKSPEMMSSLGKNLSVIDPVKKLTSPYSSMTGMGVMNAGNGGS